jgi:hypothetical protein
VDEDTVGSINGIKYVTVYVKDIASGSGWQFRGVLMYWYWQVKPGTNNYASSRQKRDLSVGQKNRETPFTYKSLCLGTGKEPFLPRILLLPPPPTPTLLAPSRTVSL